MNVKQDASLAAGPLSVEGAGGDLLASQPPRRWKKLEVQGDGELPGERSGAASVVYKDAIYVFGGYGGAGRLDDLFRYDIGR
uniref:Uncharacterized protein n=1 Tax=Chromera velia CCMP2878 TaxID=1169474 RepID=A0A0G4HFZ4_9ALVE|eukprot:Cvel_27086.t1-p1 / transcript=Cvel_27086.t1 / gene=Cvel_27086 / organism=Chromera_velia_CCMP2878 / gene_product=hypothetical protein / transcript_product=hypothetical protein / location=Cvel_scaffold3318:206-727(-) / protein_length=81 / sequence_SO=supercontig / SO=protein_coding / is_pseudo=false